MGALQTRGLVVAGFASKDAQFDDMVPTHTLPLDIIPLNLVNNSQLGTPAMEGYSLLCLLLLWYME
ncbi:hypothetical protein ACHAPG_003657 [Botrytis cinerea]